MKHFFAPVGILIFLTGCLSPTITQDFPKTGDSSVCVIFKETAIGIPAPISLDGVLIAVMPWGHHIYFPATSGVHHIDGARIPMTVDLKPGMTTYLYAHGSISEGAWFTPINKERATELLATSKPFK